MSVPLNACRYPAITSNLFRVQYDHDLVSNPLACAAQPHGLCTRHIEGKYPATRRLATFELQLRRGKRQRQPEIASACRSRPKTCTAADLPFSA
jgi:hypothetical protein